ETAGEDAARGAGEEEMREEAPAREPTARPTPVPTAEPTTRPTAAPTQAAAVVPTKAPTAAPTTAPTRPPPTAPTRPAEAPTPAAALDVLSQPIGAEIVVDGQPRGRTPQRVVGLAPGSHELVVRKEGFLPYRQTIEVEADARYELDVKLASEVNSLRVVTDPPG